MQNARMVRCVQSHSHLPWATAERTAHLVLLQGAAATPQAAGVVTKLYKASRAVPSASSLAPCALCCNAAQPTHTCPGSRPGTPQKLQRGQTSACRTEGRRRAQAHRRLPRLLRREPVRWMQRERPRLQSAQRRTPPSPRRAAQLQHLPVVAAERLPSVLHSLLSCLGAASWAVPSATKAAVLQTLRQPLPCPTGVLTTGFAGQQQWPPAG